MALLSAISHRGLFPYWRPLLVIDLEASLERWNPQLAAQTRHLSAGRRQKPSALPDTRAVFRRPATEGRLRKRYYEPAGDPPAVPRQPGDWAEEFRLPMLLTVCIEAGRRTLTHTSWTVPAHGSRKWMSGQAAALAATKDRRPFANLTVASPLRESTLPRARRPPSPLDFYLSWMSPVLVAINRLTTINRGMAGL